MGSLYYRLQLAFINVWILCQNNFTCHGLKERWTLECRPTQRAQMRTKTLKYYKYKRKVNVAENDTK